MASLSMNSAQLKWIERPPGVLGGHRFESCRGLRFFSLSHTRDMLINSFHICFTELKKLPSFILSPHRELQILRRGRQRERDFLNTKWSRARTTVILAGKCGNHRHSTTSFSKNVVVAKTNYQMLKILSFSDRKRASLPSTEISVLTFVVKKKNEAFQGVYFQRIGEKIKKLNVVLLVVLVLESKAL